MWIFCRDAICENMYEFIDNIMLNKKWRIMRNMIISIMMLDGLGHEVGVMMLYMKMFVFMYDMMIDKLNYGIGVMMLNMKMYMLICGLIVFVNIQLV